MRRVLFMAAAALMLTAACSSSESEPKESSTVPTPTSAPQPSVTPTKPAAPAPLPWGPTVAQYKKAENIVADMSVEEQAGQVIVARYDGLEPPVDLVAELGLGGVIMMGENVGTPEQVRAAAEAVQDADDRPYPKIVSVDQEGGTVARVLEPATEFRPT